jgi:hypothetical protein
VISDVSPGRDMVLQINNFVEFLILNPRSGLDLDTMLFLLGGLVLAIFVLKRELLIYKMSFLTILGIAIAIALFGVLMRVKLGPAFTAGSLFVPLVSLILYRILHKLFIRWVGMEPKDTYLNWAPNMVADRIFNIAYCTIVICLWIALPLLI